MRNNKSRNIKEYTHSHKYVGARVIHTHTHVHNFVCILPTGCNRNAFNIIFTDATNIRQNGYELCEFLWLAY